MDAGKWLSRERGALNIEEAQEFEAVPPASFPMAERIKASELVDLFRLRETLPKMKNGLPAEADNPLKNGEIGVDSVERSLSALPCRAEDNGEADDGYHEPTVH